MSTNTDPRQLEFERRFDLYFPRVYAYAFRRTQDHAAAQRIARDALLRSLPELLDADEPALAAALLRATRESLRSETTPHGAESFPPASPARPPSSLARASRSPRPSRALSTSGAGRR